jgi:hypothetical protein
MAVITTGAHPKALWPGVANWFGQVLDEYPKEYAQMYDEETSDKAYEEDVEGYGFGLAVEKPQGASFTYDDHNQGYIARYTHAMWALGYIVTYEETKDNQYTAKAFKRSKMLAFSMNQTKEVNGAALLNNGFTDTTFPGDSAALFSASHPTLGGGLQSNLLTAADFSEAALEDALIQISVAQNNRGLIINLIPELLIVSPYDIFQAEKVVESPLTTIDAGNAINAVRRLNKLPKGYMVNHYLSDPDAWFIKTNQPEGLKLYQREKIQFTQDNDGDTMNAKAKAFERYKFGISDWRGIYGNPGA